MTYSFEVDSNVQKVKCCGGLRKPFGNFLSVEKNECDLTVWFGGPKMTE